MIYDKIRTDNFFNNVTSSMIAPSAALCYLGYLNDLSGRISLKINDGNSTQVISQEAKVANTSLASITNLNYQKGDIFYVNNITSGEYTIAVSNLGGTQLKGKGIILYLNSVPVSTIISFGGELIINTLNELEAESYCAAFCNLNGTDTITCISVWKTPGTVANTVLPPEEAPLTFLAKADNSSIALGQVGNPDSIALQYSKNGGEWAAYQIGDVIDLDEGETVALSGANDHFSKSENDYYQFSMEREIEAYNNIQSLMNFSDSCTNWCYATLFSGCTSLTKAPLLPATELAWACYRRMFANCTSLSTSPVLPATILADSCYYLMFYKCTSLTAAPVLPATDLAHGCYGGMFHSCTNISSAPSLPATKIIQSSYYYMFQNCSSLKTPPSLPATILAPDCYHNMFAGCSNLSNAPLLPATSLAPSCYCGMFSGCTALTSTPLLLATTLDKQCYANMFQDCTSLTSVPNLPATSLAWLCYGYMFQGCTKLSSVPSDMLPVETLASQCYYMMFADCTSLKTPPNLPATILDDWCYGNMFNKCSSLTVAPALPATGLAKGCYSWMFANCTSLTSAPALPATDLASGCYHSMFNGCNKLSSALSLPATTLADGCYKHMFQYCSNLTNINVAFTDWTDTATTSATYEWVYGVAANGTFTCPAGLDITTRDVSHVPANWIVVNS